MQVIKKAHAHYILNSIALKNSAKKLKKSGLLFALVSIDFINEEIHYQIRGLKGTFKKAIAGIKECQKEGLLTGISTVMKHKDLFNGNLENMVDFTKKLKVNEVIIYGSAPVWKEQK